MKLRELREKENYTQVALAEKLGVTSQTILNWENGIYEPNISQLCKLADIFNVSIDYLVERKEKGSIVNECITELDKIKKVDFISWVKEKLNTMNAKDDES